MQREPSLIQILGLLIGVASLALALADQDSEVRQPASAEGGVYYYDDRRRYAPPPPPRYYYPDYYEPEYCDPYYCDCGCY
jgi:hypothetical protein